MALTTNLLNGASKTPVKTTNSAEDRLSFKDFYTSGISLKQLTEGEYTCRLVSHEFVTQVKEGGQVYEFVKLGLQLEDRILTENRFEQGFGIMLSQVKAQFGIQDQALPVKEVLELMMRQEFKIWIEYADGLERVYRNVHFAKPLPKSKEENVQNIVKF